jgi:hypothetical protein
VTTLSQTASLTAASEFVANVRVAEGEGKKAERDGEKEDVVHDHDQPMSAVDLQWHDRELTAVNIMLM